MLRTPNLISMMWRLSRDLKWGKMDMSGHWYGGTSIPVGWLDSKLLICSTRDQHGTCYHPPIWEQKMFSLSRKDVAKYWSIFPLFGGGNQMGTLVTSKNWGVWRNPKEIQEGSCLKCVPPMCSIFSECHLTSIGSLIQNIQKLMFY